jgi:hypothetical protein
MRRVGAGAPGSGGATVNGCESTRTGPGTWRQYIVGGVRNRILRDESGDLQSLRLTVILLLVGGTVVVGLAAWHRYGTSGTTAGAIVAAPIGLAALGIALAVLLSILTGLFLLAMHLQTWLRVSRIFRAARNGDASAAELANQLETGWGLGEMLGKRIGEIVPLLASPAPDTRRAALGLLMHAEGRTQVDVDAALIAGLDEWTPDMFPGIWRLTQSDAARLALAGKFLSGADEAGRRALLADMFGFGPWSVPREPHEGWILVLARFEPEIRALTLPDRDRVEAYGRAFSGRT